MTKLTNVLALEMVLYTIEDLSDLLNEVLSEEDYEKSAKIRDEINRRKKLED